MSPLESWALIGALIVLAGTLGILARMDHVERRRRSRETWRKSPGPGSRP